MSRISMRQIRDIDEVILDENKRIRCRLILSNGYAFPKPGVYLSLEQLDKDLQKKVIEHYEESQR